MEEIQIDEHQEMQQLCIDIATEAFATIKFEEEKVDNTVIIRTVEEYFQKDDTYYVHMKNNTSIQT